MVLSLGACAVNDETLNMEDDLSGLNTDSQSDEETSFEERFEGVDYGGKEFTVLVQGAGPDGVFASNYDCNDFYVTKTSDSVSQAIYQRQVTTEEFLNIKLNPVYNDNSGSNLRKVANSGDNSYDMAMINLRANGKDALEIAAEGLLVNLAQQKNIDFSGKYWDQNAADTFTVNGKCYVGIGDITLADEMLVSALVYNKDVAKQHNVTNLYELVSSGNWTFEEMFEIVKNVGEDVGNDSVYDGTDYYGYLGEARTLDHLWFASGETMTHKNSDGTLYVDLVSDRSVDVIEKVFDFMNKNTSFGYWNMNKKIYGMFINDQTLFQSTTMRPIVEQLRSTGTDYGILPMPKYDTDQENYHVYQNPDLCLCAVIPITCRDVEMSSTVMETLCYYGKQILYPAIYEILLQSKVAQDYQSCEMLDLIYGNRVWDWAFATDCGGLYYFLSTVVGYHGKLVSAYEGIRPQVDSDFQKVMAFYMQ